MHILATPVSSTNTYIQMYLYVRATKTNICFFFLFPSLKQTVGTNQSGGLLSPGLSSLELDSNTSMSLPSPTSCSFDGTGSLSPSPQNPCTSSAPSTSPVDNLSVGVLPHRMSSVSPPQQSNGPNYSPFVNKISAKVISMA